MPEEFTSKRIKCTLTDAHLLRRGDERRHKFTVAVSFDDGGYNLAGMTEWVQNAYNQVQKSANKTDELKSKTVLENMSIEFFSTEKTKTAFFPIVTQATLRGFRFFKTGKGDQASVSLIFDAIFAGRKEIHDWTYDHKNADIWVGFEQAQMAMEYKGPKEGKDEYEEERQEATKPEHDAEFGVVKGGKSAAAKKAASVLDGKRVLM
jgi:hypothetical protein